MAEPDQGMGDIVKNDPPAKKETFAEAFRAAYDGGKGKGSNFSWNGKQFKANMASDAPKAKPKPKPQPAAGTSFKGSGGADASVLGPKAGKPSPGYKAFGEPVDQAKIALVKDVKASSSKPKPAAAKKFSSPSDRVDAELAKAFTPPKSGDGGIKIDKRVSGPPAKAGPPKKFNSPSDRVDDALANAAKPPTSWGGGGIQIDRRAPPSSTAVPKPLKKYNSPSDRVDDMLADAAKPPTTWGGGGIQIDRRPKPKSGPAAPPKKFNSPSDRVDDELRKAFTPPTNYAKGGGVEVRGKTKAKCYAKGGSIDGCAKRGHTKAGRR